MLSTFVIFPTTVAVSEICLGIRPSAVRAYSRVFANAGRVFGTYLLATLIVVMGLLALIVPGFVLGIWYMFVGPVVVIESVGGRAALKRSRELGRGFYWRNFGVYLLLSLVVVVVMLVVAVLAGALVGAVLGVVGFSIDDITRISMLVGTVSFILFTPVILIALVLLYYDMRARKEGYGATQLAEDLQL